MGSGPSVPDASQVSNQQTQSNIQTAQAQRDINQVNQQTPFGNLTYSADGKTATTTLSPQLQNLLNSQMGTQQQMQGLAQTAGSQAAGALGQPITAPMYSQVGSNDYSADRKRVEDAMFGRLNEQVDRDRGSLEQSLANKGISLNTDASRNAYGDFNRGVADARTNVLLAGGQEQSRLSELERANAAANNQIANQGFQDKLGIQNQALNNYLGLAGGQQVGMPQFTSTPQSGVAATDVSGNAWNAYGAQKQQSDGMWNAIGNIAGTAARVIPWSDERLKEDKQRIGKTDEGTPIYTYRYKGSPMIQMGVMAQDMKKKNPSAVHTAPGGFMAVDYAKVR